MYAKIKLQLSKVNYISLKNSLLFYDNFISTQKLTLFKINLCSRFLFSDGLPIPKSNYSLSRKNLDLEAE